MMLVPLPPLSWTELYSSGEIYQVVTHTMPNKISQISSDQRKKLVLIAILKGGVWTTYHLLDGLCRFYSDIRIGHMGISSYGNGRRPDQMKITSTLDLSVDDVKDANVWLIDDIWDTGQTMTKAKEIVKLMCPCSLNTAVLVHRDNPEGVEERPDVRGLRYTGSEFLAGCGMGCGEKNRHLDSIYIVPEE